MNVFRIFEFLYRYYRKDLIFCIVVAIIGGIAEFINLVILRHVLSSLSEIELDDIIISENNSVHALFFIVVISTVVVLLFRLLVLQRLTYGANRLGSKISVSSLSNSIRNKNLGEDLKSSSVSAATSKSLNLVNMVIYPIFLTIATSASGILIIAALAYVDFKLTVYVAAFGLIIFSLFIAVKKISSSRVDLNSLQDKHSQKLLNIIKCKIEILTYGVWNRVYEVYKAEDIQLRSEFAKVHFQMQVPRLLVDAALIIAAASIYWFYQLGIIGLEIVSLLIVFGLGFMRLIPQCLQLVQAITTISAYGTTFDSFLTKKKADHVIGSPSIPQADTSTQIKIIIPAGYRVAGGNEGTTVENSEAGGAIRLQSGSKVLLRGESGIGKTSLMNSLVRLKSNNAIGFETVRAHDLSVSYCPQFPGVITGTVDENIRFFRDCLSSLEITNLINRLGLSHISFIQDEDSVSGGELARISLGRALISKPDVLLLDETFAPLSDSDTRDLLTEIKGQKKLTVMAILHAENFDEYFDEILVLGRDNGH